MSLEDDLTALAAEAPAGEDTATSIYPPHYSFPPFFTLQPNLSTRAHQYQLWTTLICSYMRHHKLYRLKIPADLSKPPFSNPAINRCLRLEDAKKVLFEGMKEAGVVVEKVGGLDIGINPGGVVQRLVGRQNENIRESEVVVWWKRREDWASEVLKWVEENGMKGDIVTLFDFIHGDVAYFTGMLNLRWMMDDGECRLMLFGKQSFMAWIYMSYERRLRRLRRRVSVRRL
jgi:ESCRT-II complex subunit VPS25